MRLFQVIAGGQAGGFESFFTRLTANFQARDDISQKVAVRPWALRNKTLRQSGVEMAAFRMRGRLDVVGRWRLNAAVTRFKPDIIMSWANRATSITAAGGAPLVARLGHFYKLKNYRHCDGLITITRAIADYAISGGFPASRVVVVPNFFAPAGMAPIARASLDTPEDVPLILAVGPLPTGHGLDGVVKGRKSPPDANLLVGGAGPTHPALARL
ncbi:MAG: glycosyltransferase, partial [Alphaproteobacteria bacterium]